MNLIERWSSDVAFTMFWFMAPFFLSRPCHFPYGFVPACIAGTPEVVLDLSTLVDPGDYCEDRQIVRDIRTMFYSRFAEAKRKRERSWARRKSIVIDEAQKIKSKPLETAEYDIL